MLNIEPTEVKRSFVSPVMFERTGNVRDRIVDCSREELIDYNAHLVDLLQKIQGQTERMNRDIEDALGWNEKLYL